MFCAMDGGTTLLNSRFSNLLGFPRGKFWKDGVSNLEEKNPDWKFPVQIW